MILFSGFAFWCFLGPLGTCLYMPYWVCEFKLHDHTSDRSFGSSVNALAVIQLLRCSSD